MPCLAMVWGQIYDGIVTLNTKEQSFATVEVIPTASLGNGIEFVLLSSHSTEQKRGQAEDVGFLVNASDGSAWSSSTSIGC